MATLANIVRVYATTTGTGTIGLGGAVPGFLTPAQAGLANGAVVSYSIIDGVQTEVGRGAYNSTTQTITRGVLRSTNNNGLINATATAEVAITFLNEDKLDLETLIAGKISNSAGVVTNTNLATVPTLTIKGRVASGTGEVTDLTPAQVRQVAGISLGANVNGAYFRAVLGNCIILAGTGTATTNTDGEAQISYPVTFPQGNVYVAFVNGDAASGSDGAVLTQRVDTLGSASGFVFRLVQPGVGRVGSKAIRINYIAVGPLT